MRRSVNRKSKWPALIRLAVYAGIASILSLSCSRNAFEGMIVAVELPGDWKGSLEGAKLIALDPDTPGQEIIHLTPDFESACAPSLSYDARTLFFQGKQEGDEHWQIWMMDLHKRITRRVTDVQENCTHPAPLPDGTIIFSREGSIKNIKNNALFRCNRDGSGLTQLTFNLGDNMHASVLREGRVLFTCSQHNPDPKTPDLMVMRPDGTKSEIYHRGSTPSHPVSKGLESKEGYVYFIESEGKLERVLHRRPLHTAEYLARGLEGSFSAVTPFDGSICLVSYQPSIGESYALYTFDTGSNEPPTLLYKGNGNVTDPVQIKAMEERQKILPSAINQDQSTGLLMSQDINHSMLPANPVLNGDSLANRIRLSGVNGELAVVDVKKDGSFYLEIDADSPIRIETLNNQGETVRGPSHWIYLRPNERRGCVGCHADPELTPENIQPLAVKEPPVVISGKRKQ